MRLKIVNIWSRSPTSSLRSPIIRQAPSAGRPQAGRACGVLFDLDGTFADTAPDMASALNRSSRDQGRSPRPFEEIRPQVSHGGRAMIRLGFGLEPEHPDFEPLRQAFLRNYSDNIDHDTRPFPCIGQLLDTLGCLDGP